MKKKLVALTSIILCVCLLFSTVPVFAAEHGIGAQNSSLTDDMQVSGTNSFGNLLANAINATADEPETDNGYNVFSVEMDGNIATVSLEAVQNASVVVAIYDEHTDQMLASGTEEVAAGDETAEVAIDIDAMPQYFNLRAFIIEPETLRPLCTAYNCPLYTQEMQELMDMSADEFEPERVLNLDDDMDNNFAVYDENTKFIEKNGDSNNVVSTDDNNGIYVFENADSSITSLKSGDIFVYEMSNGDALIVKVAEITLDGTTATIKGGETNLDEVFDYVKIDAQSGLSDAEIDPSTCDDGVTYEDDRSANPYAIQTLASFEGSHDKTLNFNFDKSKQNGDGTIQFRVYGSIQVDLVASAKVYVTLTQQYLEVNLDYTADINAELVATGDVYITLANVSVVPVTGVTISITPAFVAQWNVQGELNGTLSGTLGLQVSKDDGIKNLSKMPTFDAELTVEGRLFVGFHLDPKVTVLGVLAEAQISGNPGVELTAKLSANATNAATSKYEHACNFCVAGDISAVISLTFDVKFLNSDKLKFSFKLIDKKIKLFDFYYSVDFDEYGLTKCPHKQYLINVTVVDSDGNPVSYAVVNGKYVTDINGRTSFYLTPGKYTITAETEEGDTVSKSCTITDEPASIVLNFGTWVRGEQTENTQPVTEPTEPTTKPTEPATEPTTVPVTEPKTEPKTEPATQPVTQPQKVESQLSLGQNHSGALLENGDLYMWGYNWNGQIGNGEYGSDPVSPVKVLSKVKAISLGDTHSAAITQNGDLYMWGNNIFGQLGDGTTTERRVPTKVMSNVKAVSLGNAHSAAIKENGDLYMWGNNGYGQLGDGTTEKSVIPVKVMSGVKAVNLGHSHSVALKETGDLYTWGDNYFGQLGNGTWMDSYSPDRIMSNVKDIEAGYHHSGAIKQNGDLYIWGNNLYGQLGDGKVNDNNSPAKVLSNVKKASFYYYHSGALLENGDLYMWGDNGSGQLGDGTTVSKQIPTKIMINVKTFALGMRHSGAISTGGDLYMWGNNSLGQLGNGTTDNRLYPARIYLPSTASIMSLNAAMPVSAARSLGVIMNFSNLISNEIYNFYAMKSQTAENLLSSDNLLYITQAESDENGELSVNYLPTEDYEGAVCFVVPMKQADLSEAEVTMDDLIYNGEEQFVNPVVTLNGETLTEGVDYKLCGDYSATAPGEYSVIIRGIGYYTGEITLTYKVVVDCIIGDVNGDNVIDVTDATLIQRYSAELEEFTVEQMAAADTNGDGAVDITDATMIQKYLAEVIDSF